MSLRLDPAEPTDMEPEDRLDEIASIFARGILRLHGRVRADIPPPQNLEGHAGAVFAAVFSPDGSRIASGGRDRVVRLWDTDRFEEITQPHGHTALIYSLAFSPDGTTLASGGGDDTVRIWGLAPFRERVLTE